MVCGEVLCDGWCVVRVFVIVVCGEVLCDGWYVVKFYVMGGMW